MTPGNIPPWHTECLNLGVDVRWLYAGLNPTLKTVTAIITAGQLRKLLHTPLIQRRNFSLNTDAASCFKSIKVRRCISLKCLQISSAVHIRVLNDESTRFRVIWSVLHISLSGPQITLCTA